MADFTESNPPDMAAAHPDVNMGTTGSMRLIDWENVDPYWRENYGSRPYAHADRSYEYYRPAYRYGTEMGNRYRGRFWDDVEPEMRAGWDTWEHHGQSRSTWDEIKDAVRDAWDKVTGKV